VFGRSYKNIIATEISNGCVVDGLDSVVHLNVQIHDGRRVEIVLLYRE
jgi:hypothetical protein